MSIFDNPHGVSFVKICAGGLILCSGIMFSYASIKQIVIRRHFIYHSALRLVVTLTVFWGILTCLRSISSDMQDLRTLFANPFVGGWPWVIPIVFFCASNHTVWKYLNRIFIQHLYFGLAIVPILLIINPELTIKYIRSDFSIFYCCGFLLLTFSFQSKKVKIMTVIATLVWLLGTVLHGQRVYILRIIYYIVASSFIFVFMQRKTFGKTVKLVSLFVVVASLFSFFLPVLMKSELVREKVDYLENRIFADTRSDVINDYFDAVKGFDRIVGLGALGRFWSPYFYKRFLVEGYDTDVDSPMRSTIESGYLHIILKSGYVMLVLVLLLAIRAAIMGVCYPKNILLLTCGLIIICRLVAMIPSLAPSFSPGYVVFWISIATCLNKNIKNISNEEMSSFFK
ncbi:MAG: hypothetical protein FVQ80_04885 [Planctomycetes bacterium]|nr:hypothetical protein [Planctomycetota bacterium]